MQHAIARTCKSTTGNSTTCNSTTCNSTRCNSTKCNSTTCNRTRPTCNSTTCNCATCNNICCRLCELTNSLCWICKQNVSTSRAQREHKASTKGAHHHGHSDSIMALLCNSSSQSKHFIDLQIKFLLALFPQTFFTCTSIIICTLCISSTNAHNYVFLLISIIIFHL